MQRRVPIRVLRVDVGEGVMLKYGLHDLQLKQRLRVVSLSASDVKEVEIKLQFEILSSE